MQAWTSDRRLPARDRGVGPPHEFALARLRRPLVLAVLDVDAIKTVSDYLSPPPATSSARCGHGLASTLRSYNAAVRWRGDEFACVCPA